LDEEIEAEKCKGIEKRYGVRFGKGRWGSQRLENQILISEKRR
jgi:hypothetical protein